MNKWIKLFFIGICIVLILLVILGTIAFYSISDPHTFYNLSNIFMDKNKLSIAAYITEKGIEKNTVENLKEVHPKMSESSIRHQMNLENARLFSNYAWIQFLQNKKSKSQIKIRKAVKYFDNSSIKYDADILIRDGIITYFEGDKIQAWKSLVKSFLLDSNIENKNLIYKKYLENIIHEKIGNTAFDIDEYIFNIRKNNALPVPKIVLNSPEKTETNFESFVEPIKFVLFFNPTCGSCRMEIPKLTQIFSLSEKDSNFRLIFILNRPDLYNQAQGILNENGFGNVSIYTIKNVSAYEYIPAEPCTWIIGKYNKIRFQHLGYSQGNETIFLQEIKMLLNEISI